MNLIPFPTTSSHWNDFSSIFKNKRCVRWYFRQTKYANTTGLRIHTEYVKLDFKRYDKAR